MVNFDTKQELVDYLYQSSWKPTWSTQDHQDLLLQIATLLRVIPTTALDMYTDQHFVIIGNYCHEPVGCCSLQGVTEEPGTFQRVDKATCPICSVDN